MRSHISRTQTDIRFHGFNITGSRNSTRLYGPRDEHKMGVKKPKPMLKKKQYRANAAMKRFLIDFLNSTMPPPPPPSPSTPMHEAAPSRPETPVFVPETLRPYLFLRHQDSRKLHEAGRYAGYIASRDEGRRPASLAEHSGICASSSSSSSSSRPSARSNARYSSWAWVDDSDDDDSDDDEKEIE